MAAIGVNFLNLHQLNATRHNYRAFLKRRYHFLHQPSVSILESEMCALQLLLYAKENHFNLPINYCCSAYKSRFHGLNSRRRIGGIVLKGCEELTPAAYIRSFRVADSRDKILSLVNRLEKQNCPSTLWEWNAGKTEVTIPSELLRYVDWSSAAVTLIYSEPGVMLKNQEKGATESNLEPVCPEIHRTAPWSETTTEGWRRLYKEGNRLEEVVKFVFQNYPLGGDKTIVDMNKEIQDLKEIAAWEEVESGLPELF